MKKLLAVLIALVIQQNMIFADASSDLISAAISGNYNQVQIAINKKANINFKDPSNGNTALHYAAFKGSMDILKILLEKGAAINDKNNDGETPLLLAVKQDNAAAAKYLIEKNADVKIGNKNKWTPLHEACVARSNARPFVPEMNEIVRLLIEKKADINAKDKNFKTPLILTADEMGRVEKAKILLEKGAEVNLFGAAWNALHTASYINNLKVAEVLIEKGANINLKSQNSGETALIIAAGQGNIALVKLLLSKGADKSVKNNQGKTALDIATSKNNKDLIVLLK